MMNLNYHHLYYFYAIARHGGVAPAAKQLLLAQPTLSIQLKQFEKSLGKRLFERVGKRLVLTPDGRGVLRYAESIFALGRELEDMVRDTPAAARPGIQLGVALGIPKAFSHELLRTAMRAAPGGRVECREAPLEELIDLLAEYRLDAVLSDEAVGSARGGTLRHTEVGRLPVVLAAAPKLAKRLGKARSALKALHRAPLILPRSPAAVARGLTRRLAQANVVPDIVAEVQDVETARRLALEGLGLAPMNRHTFLMSRPKGGLVAVGKGSLGFEEPLFLVESAERLWHNPLVETLRKMRL